MEKRQVLAVYMLRPNIIFRSRLQKVPFCRRIRTSPPGKLPWLFAGAGTLIVFIATLLHLWSVYAQLKEHVYLDGSQALSFVELRFLAYEETLSLLKNPPPYLQNPAWLVDEFQSQPFLYGVLIWYDDEILLNSFPHALVPDKKIVELASKGVEDREIFYLSDVIKRKNGQPVNVLVAIDTSFRARLWQETVIHGVVILLGGLAFMGFLGFIMSRLIRREHRILRRLADTEKLAAAGRLSAMLAHEIRNPLNTLSMGLQYLKEFNQAKPELVGKLQKEVQKLDELIYELLEVAKGIEVRPMQVQASQVLLEIENEFSSLVEARKIDFEVVLEKDFSFQADLRWLMRGLSNLVRNALEAVEDKGQVKIRAWQSKDKAVFEVIDNGPGLTEEQIANIKRPFYTTKKQGFGIGLYLADMVAKAHKGELVIESKPGRGSRMRLRLGLKAKGERQNETDYFNH